MAIMTRQEFFDHKKKWENEYPPDVWKYQGVDYWPMISIMIFFGYHRKHRSSQLQDGGTAPTPSSFLTKAMKSVNPTKLKRVNLGDADVLFLGNRFQSVSLSPSSPNRWYLLVYKMYDEMGVSYRYINTADFRNDVRLLWSRISSKILGRRESLPFYTPLKQLIDEVNQKLDTQQSADFISEQILYADAVRRRFVRQLSRNAPKAIFISPYYFTIGYALMAAARKLGIHTVDMQHGAQGSLHIAYAGYAVTPSRGFDLLPQYFWCWDEASASSIATWAQKQNFHEAKDLGNPWFLYHRFYKKSSQKLSRTKPRILITLQPIGFPEYVYKTIAQTHEQYDWWIRCHPTKPEQITELVAVLKEFGIDSVVNVDQATELPLPEILAQTDLHISQFSGSILEASFADVPSVIISDIGADSFSELLDSGRAITYLGDDAEGFSESIKKALSMQLHTEEDLGQKKQDLQAFLRKLIS